MLKLLNNSKQLSYALGLLIILILVSIIAWSKVTTFDDKGYSVQLYFGLPATLVVLISIHYRRWKLKISKWNRAQFIFMLFPICAFGLLASLPFAFWSELVNASWKRKTVEDEVILVEKGGSKGTYRAPESYLARFSSQKGNGDFSINTREAADLIRNRVYRIHYNIGLFGWKYQIGPIDAVEKNPAPIPTFNEILAKDTIYQKLLREDSLLKGLIRKN